MKVTIEVTKKEKAFLLEAWGTSSINDYKNDPDFGCCIKLARAIKKMEKERGK